MSVHAIDSVLAIPASAGLSHVERLTLFVLANRMSEAEGHCWPGMESIASQAGVSRSTALRAIQSLQDEGWIEVETRTAENGRKTTNLYRFTPQTFAYQNVNTPPDVAGGMCQGVTPGLLAQKRQVSQPDTSLLTVTKEEKKVPPLAVSSRLDTATREETSNPEAKEAGGGGLFDSQPEKRQDPLPPSGGVQEAQARMEARSALEGAGVFGSSADAILRKVSPSEVMRKTAAYHRALRGGRDVGPGVLTGALLNGQEIAEPKASAAAATAEQNSIHVFTCDDCKGDEVRIVAGTLEDFLGTIPTCRKCGGRLRYKESLGEGEAFVGVAPDECEIQKGGGSTWLAAAKVRADARAAREEAANVEARKTLTLGKDTRVTGREALDRLRKEVATAHG